MVAAATANAAAVAVERAVEMDPVTQTFLQNVLTLGQ
jgi:hypothetical protein